LLEDFTCDEGGPGGQIGIGGIVEETGALALRINRGLLTASLISRPPSTIRAPSSAMRARLTGFGLSGKQIVAGIPSSLAAYATAAP